MVLKDVLVWDAGEKGITKGFKKFHDFLNIKLLKRSLH